MLHMYIFDHLFSRAEAVAYHLHLYFAIIILRKPDFLFKGINIWWFNRRQYLHLCRNYYSSKAKIYHCCLIWL